MIGLGISDLISESNALQPSLFEPNELSKL